MVEYGTDRVFKIIDTATPGARIAQAIWLTESAEILTSNANRGATVVVDFSYTASTIVEYTLNDGVTWIAFNDNLALAGGQSRYVRVQTGDKVNFRGTDAGTLTRCVLGEI